MILRRIARPMLAAVFVSGGIDTLRNPKPRVDTAAPVVEKAAEQLKDKIPPQIPTDPALLVQLNAAAQVGAGIAFGLGRFPRLSAFVLASSLAPTTAAGHRFWEEENPTDRAAQRTHFLKNLGLLGGLLIAAADTHGKPSLSWRARRATEAMADSVQGSVHGATSSVQGAVEGATKSARGSVKEAANAVEATAKALKKKSAAIVS
jgi:uncharacterized membrane protein YphA (DoxX/SURF4 family)